MIEHRSCAKLYRGLLYNHMRELDADCFNIVLLESRVCESLIVARMFEQQMIEKYKPELNSNKTYRVETEQIKLEKQRMKIWKKEHPAVDCHCGGRIDKGNPYRHAATKRHLNWLRET